jgi:glycosyltransferase involved in cell wall biosynthesis
MRRLRVLHVVGSLEIGGGQKLTALVAAGLDRSRFEVAVLNLGPDGPYGDYLRRRGIPVIDLDMPMGIRLSTLRSGLRGIWRVLRFLLGRPRWDVVHTHMFRTSLLCALPARLAGSRLFGTVHRIYYPWQPIVERLLAPLHEAIVVDSAAVGRILRDQTRIPQERYVVIHNGIDTAEFEATPTRAEARRALDLPASDLVISEIAHLAPHKGQIHLVRALARLERHDVRLLLVGDGPSRATIEDEAARLGLRDRVTLTGARADLPLLLAATDVLALPSTFEGFGIVQAEAMYLGIPVVSSDRGGSTEVVVEGQTGFLVPFGDEAALADRLARLVDSPDLRRRLGQAGRERVLERFTQERMAARYARLYEGAIERGLGPAADA